MQKIQKTFFLLLTIVCSLVIFAACNVKTNKKNKETNKNENNMEKYFKIEKDGSEVLLKSVDTLIKDFTKITIPKHITRIGNDVFREFKYLESVDLSNVKEIGDYAFLNCEKLTDVYSCKNLEHIGGYAFKGCENLSYLNKESKTNVEYSEKNKKNQQIGVNIQNNFLEGKNTLPPFLIKNIEDGSVSYSFPNLKYIGSDAFNGCHSLKGDWILENIEYIGQGAFIHCKKLDNVTLSSQIKSIESHTFDGCSSLKKINLENVKYIGEYAFNGCNALRSINFKEILGVSRYSFTNCESLETVTINQDPNGNNGTCRVENGKTLYVKTGYGFFWYWDAVLNL